MADLSKTIPAVVDSDVIEDYSALPREIGIYEISGPLFFASAKQYCEVLKSTGLKSKIIIIRMRHVPFVDSTGLQNLTQTLKILKDSGIKVILSGVNVQVKQALAKSNIFKLIDEEFVLESFDKALQKAQKMID
nr:sodium-independent anion transporter [Maribellus maritimus]